MLFYVNIYGSHKLLKTVRFFWPTLYNMKCIFMISKQRRSYGFHNGVYVWNLVGD